MQDQSLHYFVAVRHVGDHVRHVVLRCPHQSGTEHQSQVPWLHLETQWDQNDATSTGHKLLIRAG